MINLLRRLANALLDLAARLVTIRASERRDHRYGVDGWPPR